MFTKGLKRVLLFMLCLGLVAGCTGGQSAKEPEQQSLRVMFWDESYFFQQYGDLFSMQHPNIEIEVVSSSNIYRDIDPDTDYEKALDNFIEKEQPDIIMVMMDQLGRYAEEGRVRELDSLIERDKYDIETIYPALIELIRDYGDGKLYGLTPNFYGTAIMYNVDLFNKYGVKLPHDGMSWYDILELAKQFPTDGDEDSRVYGFDNNWGLTLSQLTDMISSSEGVEFIDTNNMRVTLNTDSWKKIIKSAHEALEADVFYAPENGSFFGGSIEDYYKSQPFLIGRAAMTVNSSYILRNLSEVADTLKDYEPFELGIVAGPADSADPTRSRNINTSDVFAISANSPNTEAAWEFIKFINSDQFAKIKSRSLNNGLLARMGHSMEYNGHSLEAFYKLKPLPIDRTKLRKIPSEFYDKYYPLFEQELQAISNEERSIDEALAKLEGEAQVLLDQAIKEKEEKEKAAEGNEAANSESNNTGESDEGNNSISIDGDSAEADANAGE